MDKQCPGCDLNLAFDAFARDASRADKYTRLCRSCDALRKGCGDERLIADITAGGDQLASFGSPIERASAEQLIAAGSIAGAAELLGITPATLRAHLSELRRKAATRGYAPGNDMTKTTPEGFSVKGVSTYYDQNGDIRGQWVKTKREEEDKLAALLSAMSHVADAWQDAFDPVVAPTEVDSDLLCVYPMGDPHVGMFAWAAETGQSFDCKIAERNLVAAVDQLVAGAPAAKEALIINLGDFFHADNSSNQTSRSHHSLDVDTRWAKVLEIGVRTMRRIIDRALEKHERVSVITEIGNHDDHSSIMLAVCLKQAYEREERVFIDTSPAKFHWHRWGTTLIGVTHGDTCKPDKLGAIMACDQKVAWGETDHRYWYTGHVHHDSLKEYPGVIVETFRTLAPRDAWHAAAGYRSGQDMKVDVIHREHGRITRNTVGVAQLHPTKGSK